MSSLIEPLFFDTDCLSAFLWVNGQSILAKLYPARIIIPAEVYAEISNPTIQHLKYKVDTMISCGDVRIESIVVDTNEYRLYRKLTTTPEWGHKIIGRGEAAAIALAKEQGGIIASNNLKDIAIYVEEYNLKHKTTGVILREALEASLITEADGNQLWAAMLKKRRKLGFDTFTEYLQLTRPG